MTSLIRWDLDTHDYSNRCESVLLHFAIAFLHKHESMIKEVPLIMIKHPLAPILLNYRHLRLKVGFLI